MKVLHVIPSLAIAHGGPTRAIALIERALTAQGIEVETATTDDDGSGQRDRHRSPLPHAENGVIRRYFPMRSRLYKISPEFARWVFRHAGDYDLLHVHALFSFTSVAAALAARRAGTPYIVRPLGTLNRYGIERRRPALKRLSLALLEGPLLRDAAGVHFTSDAERLEAQELGIPMRSIVIPLGVEAATAVADPVLTERFPALRGARCMLFLSRLDPKKNLEALLHAFSLCHQELADARLLVAGDGDAAYAGALKALAQRLGLADKVVWAGYLDGAQKAEALASAQLFVLPSFSENFGIAAAEALMAGLPCILGSGVAVADAVAAAGAGLSVAVDPETLAGALTAVMTDDRRRISMGMNARRIAAERFSVDSMAIRIASLYSAILSTPRTDA